MTSKLDVTLQINGRAYQVQVEPRRTLADTIRELLVCPAETEQLRQRALARGSQFRWRDNAAGVYSSLVKAAV